MRLAYGAPSGSFALYCVKVMGIFMGVGWVVVMAMASSAALSNSPSKRSDIAKASIIQLSSYSKSQHLSRVKAS